MSKEKPDDLTDIERLRHWMEAVGGNIFLGLSALKSIEESKDGDKLTIVLKKKKQKANTDDAKTARRYIRAQAVPSARSAAPARRRVAKLARA